MESVGQTGGGLLPAGDLAVDAKGRIYVGSVGSSGGALHCIELDGSSHVVATEVQSTDGLGFSPDGTTLYLSDSRRNALMRYDVHDDGSLADSQIFVEPMRGSVAGLAVSTDGAVWVALASGGHGVEVYEPDGSSRAVLSIPQPTCTGACFGGPDLRDVYITSGSDGTSSDRAGSVGRYRVEVSGVPLTPARVSLTTG